MCYSFAVTHLCRIIQSKALRNKYPQEQKEYLIAKSTLISSFCFSGKNRCEQDVVLLQNAQRDFVILQVAFNDVASLLWLIPGAGC